MSVIERIRTTAFRLDAEHLGSVYVYRPGERFVRAWESLERRWKPQGELADFKRLPYRGLATALRVLSGDFVALERRVGQEHVFVISRKPISLAELRTAVSAWETRALEMFDKPVSRALEDLACEEVNVAGLVERRAGLCPTIENSWVWDVGIWEVAHRLCSTPMQTDGNAVQWRLDSDASLLTWDAPVQTQDGRSAAMHKLTLHLMTIPGVEEPVLSIQAGLVRLAPAWRFTGGARYAWADLGGGAPLLRARVRNRRLENGQYRTEWDDRAAEVLQAASLDPLPSTEAEPTVMGSMRTGYSKQPRTHGIGRGVGPWFHECVAHHARQQLGAMAEPVVLSTQKVRSGWKQLSDRVSLGFAREHSTPELRLNVVYSASETRKRVLEAVAEVLKDQAHPEDAPSLADITERLRLIDDNEALRVGPVEVCFQRPPDAHRWLLQRNEQDGILDWATTRLVSDKASALRTAAIIETDEQASEPKKADGLADPKQVLRGWLAERGIVTQFITQASAPTSPPRGKGDDDDEFRDHAAANAVGDLLRSSGYFLRPFPEFGCGKDTLVVGIYGARLTSRTTKREATYVVNLVAVSLGTRDAWGYAGERGWVPIDQATAWFLSTDQHEQTPERARQHVERAVAQLPARFGDSRAVLAFDAYGCRRFWPCLTDKSGVAPDPWMTRNGYAVVRVRTATSEIVRPAGAGEWNEGFSPAKHTDFRLMTLIGGQGETPTYILAGTAVMSRESSLRKSTRLVASDRDLRKDWHSLGVTELRVLSDGPWNREALLGQVALLCRVAPTWDRTLRWPSPLHLARAVVRDHPHSYFADGEEDEDVEDSRQMRFDFRLG